MPGCGDEINDSAVPGERGRGKRRRLRVEHRKPRLAGAVFAALAVGVLAACGSASGHNATGTPGIYGTQPAVTSGTEHMGTITFGYLSSYAPTEIVPIPTSAANSTYNEYQLNWQMYRPLYYAPDGYDATEWTGLSLANDPVYSDGDTTVSVTLKGTYKWSDGTPVTAKDVLFWYDLMKAGLAESPANWGDYAPGVGIPDEVSSVAVTGTDTIVFHLKKAVNPTWFTLDELGNIEPMPSHTLAKASADGPILDFTNPSSAKRIYNFLMNESKDYASYATNPLWKVVDGPYTLTAFNATSGTYTLTPNTAYRGPHATGGESAIEFLGFSSETAEYLAVEAGQLDVTRVPDQDIPQSASLKDYYTFGAPQFGFDAIALNFEDTTGDFNHIIAQLYIRQALQHLVPRRASAR
jgi:peptide/nickel transport system substrate-binding protein